MRIAFISTRGIPNDYGGFEQFAEYISVGLANRGHEVTVYSPHFHPYKENSYKGVRIKHIYSPETWMGSSVGSFFYDFASLCDALKKEDFDIIARVQGVYQDKLQGYVHFYDNENPDADIVSVGEDGTAVLKWTKPGESFVGTHSIKAKFDFGEFDTWESRYNTPAQASLTFEISKAAPPAEDKPEDSDKPDNSDKPDQSGSQSSSSGRDKSSGSGATRRDPVRGRTNSITGILTGTANSTANDGKSHWMQDEHGWWLRFADSSYPKAEKRGTNGIAYAWEQVNGNWWAFDESGYIKTGWMRDEDYGGWFYLDPEHGMQTGWVLIDGKWHYFHPTSDGRKGILYVGRLTPDGYYVDENGVWDGKDRQ